MKMITKLLLAANCVFFVHAFESAYALDSYASHVVLGIHGGTGIDKRDLTPELEKQYRSGLEKSLRAGYDVLQKKGASSLDAVEAAVRILEDDPLFNAGKGAVFTHDGKNELDASIMNGKDKSAGAVASVTTIKNPISAARAVMEKSPHVLLVGRGAEQFATKQGLTIVDPSYFWTETRWKELQKKLQEEKNQKKGASLPKPHSWGTVGAVALDAQGNLAAGTSTGGLTNKYFGRVGDSPIIGAGTYADNEAAAVSCTGHGEFFIRYTVASDIAALVRYKGLAIDHATNEVVQTKLKRAGGEGGVIALDPKGRFSWSFNSEGLYRGYITTDGKSTVALYEH